MNWIIFLQIFIFNEMLPLVIILMPENIETHFIYFMGGNYDIRKVEARG